MSQSSAALVAGEMRLVVKAHNLGASAVTVSAWGVRLPNNVDLQAREALQRVDRVPLRLEPGGECSFYLGRDDIATAFVELGITPSDGRPWVRLGTREMIFAKRSNRLVAWAMRRRYR